MLNECAVSVQSCWKKITYHTYNIKMLDNVGIFKIFNVYNIYFYYDDEPLYPDVVVDSRLSLLQVERTNVEHFVNLFIH